MKSPAKSKKQSYSMRFVAVLQAMAANENGGIGAFAGAVAVAVVTVGAILTLQGPLATAAGQWIQEITDAF